MAIGSFGEVIFEYRTDKKLYFEGLTGTEKARWARHELLNVKPRSEFLGAGDSENQLPIVLKAINGVNPQKEFSKIKKMLRTGIVESLIIGKITLGKYYIESINWSLEDIDNDGIIWSIKVDLSLKEYCDEEYVDKTDTSVKAVLTKDNTRIETKTTKKTTKKNTTKGTKKIDYEVKVKKKIGGSLES